MIVHHQKLVRDQIPRIIKESGKEFSIHLCDEEELLSFAKKKLLEEAQEFVENPSAEEAADILEILYFITARMDISKQEICADRISKFARNGGFDKGIVLEWVKE